MGESRENDTRQRDSILRLMGIRPKQQLLLSIGGDDQQIGLEIRQLAPGLQGGQTFLLVLWVKDTEKTLDQTRYA